MDQPEKPGERIASYQMSEGLTGHDVRCLLCPHGCVLRDGAYGLCRVRRNEGGMLRAVTYGRAAAIALDPVEKKPLRRFMPGTMTYSVGFHGCNLQCVYCQNARISFADLPRGTLSGPERYTESVPVDASGIVEAAMRRGAPSVSYTYSEPLVSYEFVLETAMKAHAAGLRNILVTNGYINPAPMRELLPWIDAMNIDLKSFDDATYRRWCGGRLQPVLDTIALCHTACHVEVTTLVVPGMNDSLEALVPAFDWLATLDRSFPLHLSRCFPANHHTAPPTDLELLFRLAEAAKERLEHVYVGNI